MGRGPGTLPARGHAGRRFQDRRVGQRRDHRRDRRDRLRLSGCAVDPRSRCSHQAAATNSRPRRCKMRCASCCCRKRRSSRRTALEVRRLAEADDDDETSLAACAAKLVELGAEFVLVTGTHDATPQVVNTLYGKDGVVRTDAWARLPGSYHGSGCTLASGHCGDACQRARIARSRPRSAGLHVARAQEGVSTWHGSVPAGPTVLGA